MDHDPNVLGRNPLRRDAGAPMGPVQSNACDAIPANDSQDEPSSAARPADDSRSLPGTFQKITTIYDGGEAAI